jgi:hypothetical protein
MSARRSLWLADLLRRVLGSLSEKGIEALPYKGPVLAQELYGDIAMRQYIDLDILVREVDVDRATAALAEVGLTPHLRLRPAEHKAYIQSGYEFVFDGFGNANVVELQWRILPRFYAVEFDTEAFFQRARGIEVSGMKVATLSSEDLFLVLCVHAAKHLWARLSWIYEIAGLSTAGDIDWDRVKREATRLGIQWIVGVSCRLGQDLFGVSIPRPFDVLANSAAVEQIARTMVARLLTGEQPDTESLAYFRQIMDLREHGLDQLRFVFRLASTPSVGEWEAVRLPKLLFPLYRVVRLVRLARKLG